MKILYGVQGTGNGHTTRARVMAQAFSKANVQVDWVFSGRDKNSYFDMEVFGDYRCFEGMTFAIKNGGVSYARTALNNSLGRFWQEVRELDVADYDLAIVDFEPVTAWAARRAGLPAMGLSHQCAFLHDVPKRSSNLITEGVMRAFAPVDLPVGLHWHHYDAPILPPIVDTEHLSQVAQVPQEPAYLFYHPFMDLSAKLSLLMPLREKFYVYHQVAAPMDHGNVQVLPYSRGGFQHHLGACQGVICSAGFELTSEAMHLGKKLLVTPLQGQMEQLSNCAALEELGIGSVAPLLTTDVIAQWVHTPQPMAHPFPDVAAAVVRWLLSVPRPGIESLQQQLWREPSARKQASESPAAEGARSANFRF